MINWNQKNRKNKKICKARSVSSQIVCRTAWLHVRLNSSNKVLVTPSDKGRLCTWCTDLYRTLYTLAERRFSSSSFFPPAQDRQSLRVRRFSHTYVVLISLVEIWACSSTAADMCNSTVCGYYQTVKWIFILTRTGGVRQRLTATEMRYSFHCYLGPFLCVKFAMKWLCDPKFSGSGRSEIGL